MGFSLWVWDAISWARDEEFNYPDYLLGIFQQMYKTKFQSFPSQSAFCLHLDWSTPTGWEKMFYSSVC